MARKDVFKGTLEALINPAAPPARPSGGKSILQSAALGGVEAGLARSLQLLELDPATISGSEFEDRLPHSPEDLADLVTSIRDHGQQIPILVHRLGADSYRIIYGRRRLAAIRQLGQKVRALVTQMDDDQRIIAQGVENTVRRDLSFVEKALFAHRLRLAEVDDATIRAALNIDVGAPKATTISTMKLVVEVLGEEVILAIGRAPGIGRPRWRALAETFRDRSVEFADVNRAALIRLAESAGFTDANPEADGEDPSDQRFKAVFAFVQTSGQPNAPAPATSAEVTEQGSVLGAVKRSPSGVTLSFRARNNAAFHDWLSANAEAVIRDLHARWADQTDTTPDHTTKEARSTK